MANPFDAVVSGVLGDPSQGLGDALGKAVEVTKSFGGVGDVGAMVGGLTGSDPFTNLQQSKWERLFAIASLAGAGSAVAAFRASKGQHVAKWARDAYPPGTQTRSALLAPTFDPYGGPPRLLPVGPTPSDLAKLHQPLPDTDIFWATTKGYTNRYLSIDTRQADTGWAALARAVVTDEVADIGHADQFIYELGHRLQREALPHSGNLPLDAARWGLTQWESALDQDLLTGKLGKQARKIWHRLQAGHTINPDDQKVLSDAITRFQSTVGWIDHPELALHPQLKLHKVDLDGVDAAVEFEMLQFEGKSLAAMTQDEAQVRMAQLFSMHPAAMVPIMSDNIVKFYRQHVSTAADIFEGGETSLWKQWQDWYPTARRDADKVAANLGTANTQQVTVVASVLSGGEGWETNLPKAEKLIKLVQKEKMGPGYFDRVHKKATSMGLKSSRDDVVRAYVAMQLEDPVSLFTTGTTGTKGKTLNEVSKLIEAGEDPMTAAGKRKISQPHQSLKQDEFAYSILFSHDEDIAERTRALLTMMRGEMGTEGHRAADIHFATGRKSLPVVVDRQAVKIALGMSLEPGTDLSSKKGMFDAFAQSYRIAAAQLGEIPELGRRLTPEELQAITWMRWREVARVKAKGAEGEAAVRNIYDAGTKHAPGFLAPGKGVGGWTVGQGPGYIFDDRVLRLIQGEDYRLAISGAGAIDAGQDPYAFAKKAELVNPNKRVGAGDMRKRVRVLVDPQGNMQLVGGEELQLRGRWPTFARIDGNVVLAPSKRARVDDAMSHYKRLAATAYDVENPDVQGTTGARFYPMGAAPDVWNEPGHHMLVSAPVEQLHAFDGALAELRSIGVKVEMRKHGNFLGRINVEKWDNEQRIGAVYTFETVDDMEAANRYLTTPDDEGVAPFKRLWKEDVTDLGYYTDGPGSAPSGTVPLHEFHYEDGQGNVLVHVNKAGETARSNSVQVYVTKEFGDLVSGTRTRSLDFGTGGHHLETLEPETGILDGQAQIVAPGHKLKTDPKAKGVFPSIVKVDGKVRDDWFVYLDPAGGLPTVATEKLPGWSDEYTFKLSYRPTKGKQQGAYVLAAHKKNPVLASEAADLLYRIGLSDRLEFHR